MRSPRMLTALIVAAAVAGACMPPPPPAEPPKATPKKKDKPAPPPPKPEGIDPADIPPDVDYENNWRSDCYAPYLLPARGLVSPDGGYDVMFHFHGGTIMDNEWRNTNLNAAIVVITLGVGSAVYADAFSDPDKLNRVLEELNQSVSRITRKNTHVRRVGLLSWSAGYGATNKILQQSRYDYLIDSVVLLDGLHANYAPRSKKVETKNIEPFIAYAREAAKGRKQMVISFSNIQTFGYASSRESATALLEAVGVEAQARDQLAWKGMRMTLEGHEGELFVRGFAGENSADHTEHLKLTEEMIRWHVVTRWHKLARKEREQQERAKAEKEKTGR